MTDVRTDVLRVLTLQLNKGNFSGGENFVELTCSFAGGRCTGNRDFENLLFANKR